MSAAAFLVFWGAWLLVPILVDGLAALVNLVGVWLAAARERRASRESPDMAWLPYVSIIVPVHNSEATLGPCLRSLLRQDYPPDRMEIIAVSNGTTDHSFDVFSAVQSRPWPGRLVWMQTGRSGKAWALNAGIHVATGQILMNVDSDVVLHRAAVRRMVERFQEEPLGAATGAVVVRAPSRETSGWHRLLAACEYLEYLSAFVVGRRFQTLSDSLYTLAGAFSAFRREALLETFLYSKRTVSEDTDLTFALREKVGHRWKVACVPEAIAYVEPTPSLAALHAQRTRWQRGELEVSSLYPRLSQRAPWKVRGFAGARVLLVDHTLAFPRLAWTFLFPTLGWFGGYPWSLILWAFTMLYFFYVLVEAGWTAVCYLLGDRATRQQLQRCAWAALAMPLYRFAIFWFRMDGFLRALAEPPTWRVRAPWVQARESARAGARWAWQVALDVGASVRREGVALAQRALADGWRGKAQGVAHRFLSVARSLLIWAEGVSPK
ncbi:MAG: glycosyltransferase [Anaerolineae bacterium]